MTTPQGHGGYDVRITALRQSTYPDLSAQLEYPLAQPCCVRVGQVWTSHGAAMPAGMCEEAWKTLQPFVQTLCDGGGHFYGEWMRNPYSACVSCNDGFRPMSFLLERL